MMTAPRIHIGMASARGFRDAFDDKPLMDAATFLKYFDVAATPDETHEYAYSVYVSAYNGTSC